MLESAAHSVDQKIQNCAQRLALLIELFALPVSVVSPLVDGRTGRWTAGRLHSGLWLLECLRDIVQEAREERVHARVERILRVHHCVHVHVRHQALADLVLKLLHNRRHAESVAHKCSYYSFRTRTRVVTEIVLYSYSYG